MESLKTITICMTLCGTYMWWDKQFLVSVCRMLSYREGLLEWAHLHCLWEWLSIRAHYKGHRNTMVWTCYEVDGLHWALAEDPMMQTWLCLLEFAVLLETGHSHCWLGIPLKPRCCILSMEWICFTSQLFLLPICSICVGMLGIQWLSALALCSHYGLVWLD